MGHLRNYTIGDVTAAFTNFRDLMFFIPWVGTVLECLLRMLQLKIKLIPEDGQKNITNMKIQLKKLDCHLTGIEKYQRVTEKYYKYQQKIFIDFFNNGLVYKKDSFVNWESQLIRQF